MAKNRAFQCVILAAFLVLVFQQYATAQSWIQNPVNKHSYARLPSCGTWEQCEGLAVSAGGHLVTIRNQDEQNWLISAASGFSVGTPNRLWS